jgi:hypothetical protein
MSFTEEFSKEIGLKSFTVSGLLILGTRVMKDELIL